MTTRLRQSAKMRDAQAYFQQVVKQELQVLLANGMERQAAVKRLLRRIVASTEDPEENDVRRVMRQFDMNHEDAVRALIVKQEIGRLKRQGLDAFAAIEELTRKMQLSDGDNENGASGSSSMEVDDSQEEEEEVQHAEDSDGKTENTAVDDDGDAGMAVASPDASGNLGEGSMTLCQGIDNVSISALATSREASPTAFTLFSSNSRKRRAQRPASPSPSPERDLAARFHPIPGGSSSSESRELELEVDAADPQDDDEYLGRNRRKKQRLWDGVSDSFANAVSLKNTIVAPASPTTVSSRDEEPQQQQSRTARGKRPRSTASPFDLMALGDPLFHMPKRHKN